MSVELPKDAEGSEIPLDTEVLFDKDGQEIEVSRYQYYPKVGPGYWNRIRVDFPDVFERRAKEERILGRSCINGTFLDELDPNAGNMSTEVMPACSFDCVGVLEEEHEND